MPRQLSLSHSTNVQKQAGQSFPEGTRQIFPQKRIRGLFIAEEYLVCGKEMLRHSVVKRVISYDVTMLRITTNQQTTNKQCAEKQERDDSGEKSLCGEQCGHTGDELSE